jgi:hypothetical protein
MIDITKLDPGERATVIETAACILREEFGVLTAGDLISGLTGAALSIRAQGGIIKPVIHPAAGSNKPRLRRRNGVPDEEEPRNATLERPLDDPWPERPGRIYYGDDTTGTPCPGSREAPGHGYWEAGDYP